MILSLLRQHRFYAAVCILGTAVTIAFVMVVVMVYDFRTADVAPETGRSRTLYLFRGSSIDARLVYVLLLVVLLVVPAVGISGLVHAQMQSRLSEIAIRKAYGATNAGVVCQLFRETLWTTLAGGVLGYGLSCLLVVLGSRWLFGTGGVELAGIAVGGSLLLRPVLFVSVLAACLMFNVLSALLPAVLAVRKSIGAAAAGR